jgi:hypothetical protein
MQEKNPGSRGEENDPATSPAIAFNCPGIISGSVLENEEKRPACEIPGHDRKSPAPLVKPHPNLADANNTTAQILKTLQNSQNA